MRSLRNVVRWLCLASLCLSAVVADNQTTLTFSNTAQGKAGLQLASPNSSPQILLSTDDLPGVKRAANDLSTDFGRVLGINANVSFVASVPTSGLKPAIIVGTIGSSSLVDQLVKSKQIDVTTIKGKWESYITQVISDAAGEPAALVIIGSDVRGTIFGMYDISEQIGVSPLYWWADVPPTKRQYIYAPTQIKTQGPPSVKFRGIFLNDEAPALTNWAAGNFPKSQYGNPFNSDFYARVFELVLRLKGNYIWPAMWSGMFYLDDTKSGPRAHEFGVFIGTSHHEPMARADKEQGRFCQGAWDWGKNKDNIKKFMTEGAQRAKNWDTIFTLGMRGSGDAASATLTSKSLEEVIKFQQSALKTALGKDLSQIPQTWVMYKEVPGYWQKGMDVSDDVTLLWTDDNRGNIRRIPTEKENTRSGGSGMYYHFDYVGSPRNYKWINTIQLQKTWEQMHLTYERGVQQIWIVNVGDLKPMEIPIAHFMAMAYDMSKFSTPDGTMAWLTDWSARQFGAEVAKTTAEIMSTYGILTARRKYEDLSITPFAFSTAEYDEAERNYQAWVDLLDLAQKTHDKLSATLQIPFFEMVLHPIGAGKLVFEIYTKAALASRYSSERRMSANQMSTDARDAFSADTALAKKYHGLLNGKWNHMMDQTHIGYNNWQEPSKNSLPSLSSVSAQSGKIYGVGIQSSTSGTPDAATIKLLPMNPYMPPDEERWFDIFLRGTGTVSYAITSNSSSVNVTNPTGTVNSDTLQMRSVISVEWVTVPSGSSVVQLTITPTQPANAPITTVLVPLTKPAPVPSDFKGHIESRGVVSMEANHFVGVKGGSNSANYAIIPNYGRTLSGVKLWPVTAASQSASTGPSLEYRFFTFANIENAKVTIYLSSSENSNFEKPNRYAISVDNKAQITVQPTPIASDAGQEPSGWDNAVTRNAWIRDSTIGQLSPGAHTLQVWLLEPTMVLTKIVVDIGGVKSSELGPPESMRNEGVGARNKRL